MAGHFDCIGFLSDDKDAFLARISEVAEIANRRPLQHGSMLLDWDDPSGARLVIAINKGHEVECVTPSFTGNARIDLDLGLLGSTTDCEFCAVSVGEVTDTLNDVEAYPLAFQIDDFPAVRERLTRGPITVSMTGFAEEIRVWRDEAAYSADRSVEFGEARQGERTVRYAAESLVPTGVFYDKGSQPVPQVLMSGRVLSAERRINTATSHPFQWASVRTYAAEFDIVAAAADVPDGFEPGNIIRGTFWCVGRVIDGLGTRPTGLFKRVFGR